MFVQTFQISTIRVDVALKKFKSGNIKDGRGNSSNLNKTLPDEGSNKIIKHIASFPTYVLHYCRSKTD